MPLQEGAAVWQQQVVAQHPAKLLVVSNVCQAAHVPEGALPVHQLTPLPTTE